MAYRVRLNGTNNYFTFSNTISVNLGVDAYVFESKFTLNAWPTSFGGVLGRIGTSAGFFIMPNGALALYTTGTQRFITNAGFFVLGQNRTYRFEHDANGAWRAYRDGVLFQSGTFTGSFTAAGLNSIGQGNNSDNSFCSMDLDYVLLSGPTNGQKWDADLSGGTGNILPTQSGSNNATQAGGGWPADNSEWIFYNTGGGAAELAGSAVGVSSATAALTTAIRLAASAICLSSSTASLTTSIRVQASASTVSTATAALTTQTAGMSAAASGVSSATAALTTQIRLAAAAASLSSSTANLTTGIRLVASAVSVSSSTATLSTSIRLAASAVSQSVSAASLTTAIQLQASAVAIASAGAELTTAIQLIANAVSESSATAELTTAGELPAPIDGAKVQLSRITATFDLEQLKLAPQYQMKMTRITGAYKLQQQVSFSFVNATPRFKIARG